MSKKKLVIANWKGYVAELKSAETFARALRRKTRLFPSVEVVLAPPFPLILALARVFRGSSLQVGAQTVSGFEGPAHTGDVSAQTLHSVGVSYVVIGHSERRAAGESDEIIRGQLGRALSENLTPVLCIGEKERSTDGTHFATIESQLSAVVGGMRRIEKLVIAYEPVWAIGKSAAEAMNSQELTETVIFIRKTLAKLFDRRAALRVPILYGGSVEPQNAHSLLTEGSVNGFLVGHASAELDSFIEILKAIRLTHGKHAGN